MRREVSEETVITGGTEHGGRAIRRRATRADRRGVRVHRYKPPKIRERFVSVLSHIPPGRFRGQSHGGLQLPFVSVPPCLL